VFKCPFEENVSQSMKGRPSAKKGIPQTLEHRLKNSLAQKALYARQRLEKENIECHK
jgi:hypothetical protein